MDVTVVTTSRNKEAVVLRGKPTAQQIHDIAEAFIHRGRPSAVRERLRTKLGRLNFISYTLDFTKNRKCRVMYSRSRKPGILTYRGGVVAIAPAFAAEFEIIIETVEVNDHAPHTLNCERPHHISDINVSRP